MQNNAKYATVYAIAYADLKNWMNMQNMKNMQINMP